MQWWSCFSLNPGNNQARQRTNVSVTFYMDCMSGFVRKVFAFEEGLAVG
jgi:hypothetical protein